MASTLASLTLAAQQRCDRVNATTISAAEWTSYVNYEAQALYGTLCSTYEDYNVKQYQFTLAGGDPPGNTLTVGFGSAVGDFYLLRSLMWQAASGPGVRWIPLERLNSLMERARYVGPQASLYYGQYPSAYNLFGNQLEVLPPSSSAGTYLLWYVPTLPQLVNANDTLDGAWLTINGWDEYVVLGAAAKALIKEESVETANIILQQQEGVRQRILREAQPRDDGSPGRITDVKRARALFGGPDGMSGYGRFGGW